MKCRFQTLGLHAMSMFHRTSASGFHIFCVFTRHQVGVEHAEETSDKFGGFCNTPGGIKFVLLLNEWMTINQQII